MPRKATTAAEGKSWSWLVISAGYLRGGQEVEGRCYAAGEQENAATLSADGMPTNMRFVIDAVVADTCIERSALSSDTQSSLSRCTNYP